MNVLIGKENREGKVEEDHESSNIKFWRLGNYEGREIGEVQGACAYMGSWIKKKRHCVLLSCGIAYSLWKRKIINRCVSHVVMLAIKLILK